MQVLFYNVCIIVLIYYVYTTLDQRKPLLLKSWLPEHIYFMVMSFFATYLDINL